ncbi:hypothetical protein YC2023_087697 [Brassica napus]|uniref:TF-B3 domain-containing protein n=3 Tax=Brassica TaxID=3705 RepID=A0A0D3DGN4_BRAOL|nr:unnamed protein product [Brassica napus]VDD40563.1 unnamed protein product [Brassica oleracea]
MEKSSRCSSALKDTCEANKTSLWKIRTVLTEKCEGWIYFDNNSDVENYILKNLNEKINKVKREPIYIKIDDYDMGCQHKVILGYYHKSDKYYLGKKYWRMQELDVGDEVGFFYDPIAKNVCVSVLKQAKP